MTDTYQSKYTGAEIDSLLDDVVTFKEKLTNAVDKSKITLCFHTDGLLYLFIDNEPVGNGIALPSGSSGDVVVNIDSDKNIILSGNLPSDTYTVKYIAEDGSTINIGVFALDEVTPSGPAYTNLADPTSSDWSSGRIGSDGTVRTDLNMNVVTNFIPVSTGDVVRVSGCRIDTGNIGLYNSTKTPLSSTSETNHTPVTCDHYTVDELSDTYAQITIISDAVKFVRFTCKDSTNPNVDTVVSENIIITVNQEVDETTPSEPDEPTDPEEPSYTNLAEPRSDDAEINYELWSYNARMGGDGMAAEATGDNVGMTVTNYFDVSAGDVVRFKNFQTQRIGFYDADGTPVDKGVARPSGLATDQMIQNVTSDIDITSNANAEPTEMTFTINPTAAATQSIAYARLSGRVVTGKTAEDVIITVNQEIV